MTLNCVIWIIHRNVGLKCFYENLPKCLFVIIVINSYFSYISQGGAEMHLLCGRIYNNHIIANCAKFCMDHPVEKKQKLIQKITGTGLINILVKVEKGNMHNYKTSHKKPLQLFFKLSKLMMTMIIKIAKIIFSNYLSTFT